MSTGMALPIKYGRLFIQKNERKEQNAGAYSHAKVTPRKLRL